MAFKLNPFTSGLDTVRNQMLWGSFYDTTQQIAAAANTAYSVGINSTDADSRGISIVSGSRVTFSRAGVYSVTYSVQFVNTSSSIHDINIWLRKNIIARHGSVDGHVIGCVNYVLKLAANDYLELIWSTTDVAASIQSLPSSPSGPAHPSIPGIILTAVQVA
jgi:hypothetical protein